MASNYNGLGFQLMTTGEKAGTWGTETNTTWNEVRDTFGKVFLIQDELEPIEWQLESDTKYIGEYQCYKATYTKKVEKPRTFSNNASTDDKEEENKEKWKRGDIV